MIAIFNPKDLGISLLKYYKILIFDKKNKTKLNIAIYF